MVRRPELVKEELELDAFQVDLDVFSGPFDLLLRLIARRELDITEVSLARVTDEFIGHMRRVPDLSSATEFLVVAATLLEMKASRLLPQSERDTRAEEDLSAWDLLFSRLLQYRAFKNAAESISNRMTVGYIPRETPMEPQFAQLLPELVWRTSPQELAGLAAAVLSRKPRPDEATHITRPEASVTLELKLVRKRLSRAGKLTFSELVEDAQTNSVIVARFLAILELYRAGSVTFTQPVELGPLSVLWKGRADGK